MPLKRVSKKNISSRITDIKVPKEKPESKAVDFWKVPQSSARSAQAESDRASGSEQPHERRSPPLALLIGIFLLGTVVIASAAVVRSRRAAAVPADMSNAAMQSDTGEFGTPWSGFAPLFKNVGELYGGFKAISEGLPSIIEEVGAFSEKWPIIFTEEGGREIVASLKRIQGVLDEVESAQAEFKESGTLLGQFIPFSPADLAGFSVEVRRAKKFLDALIPWLEADEDRKVAIFFSNTSEMRPGGGFLGSYAEVTIRGGSIRDITVRDINEADRLMKRKIVPPKPLQAIVSRWRAADANWFFDFPTSAAKTLDFLGSSDLYRGKTPFAGAVAISPRVVGDILAATGPIGLKGGKKISTENFLLSIQEEVQEGQAERDPAPKRILGELLPEIIEALKRLPAGRGFIQAFSEWIAEKDVLIYFRDPSFQSFFEAYDASGKMLGSEREADDYLAFASANIGGAKTDLVMKQRIVLESRVLVDGGVENRLSIFRTHTGAEKDEWWYRSPNHAYIKVFVPGGTRLFDAQGGATRKLSARVYGPEYETDAEVQAVEASGRELAGYPGIETFTESGKTVFATWAKTEMGKTTELSLDYRHRLQREAAPGGTYEFVFEKQAGSRSSYVFEIHAPVGFVWRENGLPIYTYQTDDPPGRLTVTLTYMKELP